MESKDHIGVTREIEEEWAIDHQVFCYSLLSKKTYPSSVKKLGAEGNYYQDDVEKNLLAEDVEANFGKFLHPYNCENDPIKLNEILNANKDTVARYIKFMYARSKKVLDGVNKYSGFSKTCGNMSHSTVLEFVNKITIPDLIGSNSKCEPFTVKHNNARLINNSIGLYFFPEKDGSHMLVFPLSPYRGLVFLPASQASPYFEISDGEVDTFNEGCCKLEKQIGNGFIFAQKKEDLDKPVNFLAKLNPKIEEKQAEE